MSRLTEITLSLISSRSPQWPCECERSAQGAD